MIFFQCPFIFTKYTTSALACSLGLHLKWSGLNKHRNILGQNGTRTRLSKNVTISSPVCIAISQPLCQPVGILNLHKNICSRLQSGMHSELKMLHDGYKLCQTCPKVVRMSPRCDHDPKTRRSKTLTDQSYRPTCLSPPIGGPGFLLELFLLSAIELQAFFLMSLVVHIQ